MAKLVAEGKGVTARWGLKEAVGKPASRRTETSSEAEPPGESAKDDEAHLFRGYGK